VDPIKIGCTGSPTLWPRTCERFVVSQLLGAPNQYRTPNLRSLWPCSNTRLISSKNMSNYRRIINNTRRIINNTRLISPRNTSNSQLIMNNFTKWSWTWHHGVVIHVHPLLVVWFWEQPAFSSSSSSSVIILIQYFLETHSICNEYYLTSFFYFLFLIKFYLHNWFFFQLIYIILYFYSK